MKIALLIYGSLETISGGYLYDRKLVQYLRDQGDSVEIISLPWRSYPRHLTDNLRPALYRRLLQLDVDLLLQDELNHPSLFWINQRLRNRVRYPIISIVHHLRISEQHKSINRWLRPVDFIQAQPAAYRLVEKRYLQTVDGFIFNSQTTRDTVSALDIDTSRSVIAYPAADHLPVPATLQRKPALHKPLRILFVGNLIKRKGAHHLIAALTALPADAWTLDIVGSPAVDPHYAEAIRQQIAVADLAHKIAIHGGVRDEELIGKYYHNDLLIVPSYEGFGIVYLEAMGFGLPVIASTAGAAHEIVSEGENGFLVAPDDVATLSRQIKTVIDDRTLLHKMSQAARRRYERHSTWYDTAAQIRNWLKLIYFNNSQFRED